MGGLRGVLSLPEGIGRNHEPSAGRADTFFSGLRFGVITAQLGECCGGIPGRLDLVCSTALAVIGNVVNLPFQLADPQLQLLGRCGHIGKSSARPP